MKAILATLTFAWFCLAGTAAQAQTKSLNIGESKTAASQPVTYSNPNAPRTKSLFTTPVAPPSSSDPEVGREYVKSTKSAVVRIRHQSGVVAEHPYFEVPILFKVNSDELLDSISEENVRKTAELLAEFIASGTSFRIEGHASAEGDSANNERLSIERANHIREILTQHFSLNGNCLFAKGFSSVHARHPATSPEYLLQQDRRVLVVRMN